MGMIGSLLERYVVSAGTSVNKCKGKPKQNITSWVEIKAKRNELAVWGAQGMPRTVQGPHELSFSSKRQTLPVT